LQQKKIIVTAHMSCTQQDVLEKANTAAGQNFHDNASGVINCNNWFISQEKKDKKRNIIVLQKKKIKLNNYLDVANK